VKKVIHGCPMLQSGSNRKERDRETNMIGRIREPDNTRISRVLTAITTSITGTEIDLFATRKHNETLMMK
jgi:hypothetical protein